MEKRRAGGSIAGAALGDFGFLLFQRL